MPSATTLVQVTFLPSLCHCILHGLSVPRLTHLLPHGNSPYSGRVIVQNVNQLTSLLCSKLYFQWLWTALRLSSKVLVITNKAVSCLSTLTTLPPLLAPFQPYLPFLYRHSILTPTCGPWTCISLPGMLSRRHELYWLPPSFSSLTVCHFLGSIKNISRSNLFFATFYPFVLLCCSS